MTREEYINTLELDIAELREELKTKDKAYKAIVEELTEYAEENKKLKSQLSGTTFCYDEEEHRKLKKQLEEINNIIEKCGFVNIEQLALNYIALRKQLKECYCNRTDCSSRIKDSKKYDSLVQTQETQQKEFIKYLEDEIAKCIHQKDIFYVGMKKAFDLSLQKYKKIIKN